MIINTPVVIFVYNRKKETKILIKKISKIKPKNIIFISDGPKDNDLDKRKCFEVENVIKNINWKCKKRYIKSKKNIGLKKRISTGLDKVFNLYDKAIILEDDCIPNKSFFIFCEKFLKEYKDNYRIAGITGNNFQKQKIKETFYYSKFSSIWGWATWRRVWKTYDIKIKFWHKFKNSQKWKIFFESNNERLLWEKIFDKVYNNQINSWAYSNLLCNWYYNRLTIVPKYNLIKNIGFTNSATNTKKINKVYLPKVKNLKLDKVVYPKLIEPNIEADKFDFENLYGGNSLKFPRNIYHKLVKIKKKYYRF